MIVYILLDSVAVYMDVSYTNNGQSTELQSYTYPVTVLSYSLSFHIPLVAMTPIKELKSIPLGVTAYV